MVRAALAAYQNPDMIGVPARGEQDLQLVDS